MKAVFKHIFALVGYGLIFSLLGGLAAYIYSSTRFTAATWHQIELQEEFRESRLSTVPDFASYLRLEDRLFRELHEKVYREGAGPGSNFNRYRTGSRSDPSGYAVNWNKSFEMRVDNPRGGVLMLHGLTDSPYSLRVLAEKLHEQGFWVVGLRLPGHGTIPAELKKVRWQDWAAAVRIGVGHLQKKIGRGAPLYMVGYSNGAALAVEYSLQGLIDAELPMPAGLVLLSPALGLPPVAALARMQLALAALPGLGKLKWESVIMEYDPYKYNSFPVNAGVQIYLLTKRIQSMLENSKKNGTLLRLPNILVFQSIVDATVPPTAVIDNFLNRLPPARNRLVLFDVNRRALAEGMLVGNVDALRTRLLHASDLPFELELVSNMAATSDEVQELRKKEMEGAVAETPLSLSWPHGIYSLSHVALPFPPDDPIYGEAPMSQRSKTIRLGNLALRGERGVLAIGGQQLMRLRYNPFFSYMFDQMEIFFDKINNEANDAQN
jgi:alpha-beta hydrolase superfamily lysophospholipase